MTRERLLLGPGPTNLPPSVQQALTRPLVGHLDPDFLTVMDRVQAGLRQVFRTGNEWTFSLPATGGGGMEAALVNLLEPGDRAVVCVSGVFGSRMAEICRRAGADVTAVEVPWGRAVGPEDVEKALRDGPPARLVAVVHGETSTGVLQPVKEIAQVAHRYGALVVVDTVATLGGAPVEVDAWGLDLVYSGGQKCFSGPPGVAPITVGERARERIGARTRPSQSWYLDLTLHARYWGPERAYHHTAPIPLVDALDAALQEVLAEGLEARWQRHARLSSALLAGLEALGCRLLPDPSERMPTLLAVHPPEGADPGRIQKALWAEYGIEIGGGLGPFKGKLWRIGVMGHSARWPNYALLLTALERLLEAQGVRVERGAALAAAVAAL